MADSYRGGGRSRQAIYGPTPTRESVRQLEEGGSGTVRRTVAKSVMGPEAQAALIEQAEKQQAIRSTAAFLALRGKLTMEAARRNLNEDEGPQILQEAKRLALQVQTPAATIQRQAERLQDVALDVIMNGTLGDDQPD